MTHEVVTIVGASLAGIRAAETLRSEGFEGEINLIGDEKHLPYDRPPLSKQFLEGDLPVERLSLISEEKLYSLDLHLRLGEKATSLDVTKQEIIVNGKSEHFNGLLIATGARARTLPGSEKLKGVHVLRSLDDSLSIRKSLQEKKPRVTIVGAGFIGCEVAATARSLGLEVTIVEALPEPLVRVLGSEMGRIIADIHIKNGVSLLCDLEVKELLGDTEIEGVLLSDGSVIDTELLVVGIGAIPNTEWLEDSGLVLDDGICCDATCLAAPNIVAAGDVARWDHKGFGKSVRIEHWDNAVDQASHAAKRLLQNETEAKPYLPTPWFWSDQYDCKIQLAGICDPDDDFKIVSGSSVDKKFAALYGSQGKLRAVLGMNRPRHVMKFRGLIEQGASWVEALKFAEEMG